MDSYKNPYMREIAKKEKLSLSFIIMIKFQRTKMIVIFEINDFSNAKV